MAGARISQAEPTSEQQADAPAAPGAERSRWTVYQVYVVALLVLISVCNTMDRGAMTIVQEHIKRELRLSDLQLGLLSGPAFAIFYSIAGLPVARLSERLNRGRLLAASMAFWSAATLLCSTAANFVQIALFRAGVGIGESGANPISHSLVADTFTVRQRGMAMSVLSAAIPLGLTVAPLIIGLVAHHYGWRVAFLVAGIPGMLLAPLTWLTLREPRHAPGAVTRKGGTFLHDFGWLMRNPAFVWIFVAATFNGIGIHGMGLFTTSYLLREYHLNIAQAGTIVSVAGLMGLLGTFIGGFLADRFAGERGRSYVLVPAIGAGLSFLAFAIAFRANSMAVGIGFLLLGNIATDLKNGPNWAAVQNVAPSTMRTTAAAVFFLAATVLGTGLGGFLVGAFSDMNASHHFAFGEMSEFCVGGRGREGVAAAIDAACRQAASEGLRTTLAVVPVTFLVAMTGFAMASRTISVNRD